MPASRPFPNCLAKELASKDLTISPSRMLASSSLLLPSLPPRYPLRIPRELTRTPPFRPPPSPTPLLVLHILSRARIFDLSPISHHPISHYPPHQSPSTSRKSQSSRYVVRKIPRALNRELAFLHVYYYISSFIARALLNLQHIF